MGLPAFTCGGPEICGVPHIAARQMQFGLAADVLRMLT
jgi:hypothetical protein